VVYLLVSLPIRLALEMHSPAPLWFVLSAFANDSLKAALSADGLQRFTSGPVRLNSLRQFAVFIGIAVIVAPTLSAAVGSATRMAAGYDFWTSCYHWFLGDAIAALVITPTLLYWCLKGGREIDAHVTELVALIAGFGGSLYFTFLLPHSDYSPMVLYSAVPFLIWAATRAGPIGVSTLNSLLALVSIVALVEGKGPFSANYSQHSVLSVQLFLAVTSVPMLFVAILIQQRREVENFLRESQANLKQHYERSQLLAHKLISSQEHERRRIARDLHDHLGQRLALLSVALDEASLALPAGMSAEHSVIRGLLERVDEIHDDVRTLSHQLHSSTLQYLGLVVALKGLCRETARQHHIVIDFQSNDTDGIPQEVSLCAFRVTQEALNNAVTHGQAGQNRREIAEERKPAPHLHQRHRCWL
jgi:signal transduction histidine kinase